MWYWGKRIILELPSIECMAVPARIARAQHNARQHRYYALRRSLGMTSYAANFVTPEYARMMSRRRRIQWGGSTHIGSQAWIRYHIAKTAWA